MRGSRLISRSLASHLVAPRVAHEVAGYPKYNRGFSGLPPFMDSMEAIKKQANYLLLFFASCVPPLAGATRHKVRVCPGVQSGPALDETGGGGIRLAGNGVSTTRFVSEKCGWLALTVNNWGIPIRDALRIAEEAELDLVEVAPSRGRRSVV